MIQQILARQRERVAAEKAAKAALEAEAAAGKTGSTPDGEVAAVPAVETASGTEIPASESSKLLLDLAYGKADMNSYCAIQ